MSITQANRKLWLEYIKAVRTQDKVFERQIFHDLMQNKSREVLDNNEIKKLEHFIISTVKPALRLVDIDFEKKEQNKFKLKFISHRNDEIIISLLFDVQNNVVVYISAETELLDGDVNQLNQSNIIEYGNIIAKSLNNKTTVDIINIEQYIDEELNRGF